MHKINTIFFLELGKLILKKRKEKNIYIYMSKRPRTDIKLLKKNKGEAGILLKYQTYNKAKV